GARRPRRRRGRPRRGRHREGPRAHRSGGTAGQEPVMFVLEQLGRALLISVSMLWEVLWPLALGFMLSAIVQSAVSRRAVAGALGGFDLRGVALACGLRAASSSGSFSAVAGGPPPCSH